VVLIVPRIVEAPKEGLLPKIQRQTHVVFGHGA
jgi:hypothetical protein